MAKIIERIGNTKNEINLNVPNSYVVNIQNDFIKQWSEDLISLASAIQRGDTQALEKAGELLKNIHMANLIVGKEGDLNSIKDRDYNSLSSILKKQYYAGVGDNGKKYGLEHLFKECRLGLVSDAQLRNRLNLYSKSGKATKSLSETNLKQDLGYKSKKRNLGNCIHCDDCVRYSLTGWVSIDSGVLPPISIACRCRTNCCCTFSYSKQKKH